MVALFIHMMAKFVRYALYLAIIGELSAQTFQIQQKAGASVKKGLICLKCLNDQLHQPQRMSKLRNSYDTKK